MGAQAQSLGSEALRRLWSHFKLATCATRGGSLARRFLKFRFWPWRGWQSIPTDPRDDPQAFVRRQERSRSRATCICVCTIVTNRQDKKTIFEKYIYTLLHWHNIIFRTAHVQPTKGSIKRPGNWRRRRRSNKIIAWRPVSGVKDTSAKKNRVINQSDTWYD